MTDEETGSYPPPMLIDQIEYLYFMTTEADQQLGQDAFERYEELRGQLDTLLERWSQTRQQASALSEADD